MDVMFEKIERCVAKIDGTVNGNAFLIDKGHAITVKHCVEQDRIKLVFPSLFTDNVVSVFANKDSQFASDEDEFVLLELEEELAEPNITFASMSLNPSDEAKVFGYDANYRADGRWTDLVSAAGVIPNKEMVQDMLFDLKTSRESNFVGLSGSPIVKDGYIIGITSQQAVENANAITIHGISVKSSIDFFERHNIFVVQNEDVGKYSFDSSLSIGIYNEKNIISSVDDIQEMQKRIQGIYREKLTDIILKHQRGEIDVAWDELKKQIIELDKDPYASNEVKAEYYYRMALWFLEDRSDVVKAQKKYERAIELKPDYDGCVFQALKQYMTGECPNAEDLLEPVNSASKFNVYLQICINSHKINKAYSKYEEVDQTIEIDANTYYLLSIMEIMHREYDIAMDYIEKAIEMENKIPFYHMIKGIILYWKGLPKDLILEDDLYPVMFVNGLLHLDVDQRLMLKRATEAYRSAYQLAEYVGNDEYIEVILSIWLNTLSVDSSFQNDIIEPLQLLKEKNPFNITALFYMLQKRMVLDSEVTIENLEQCLRNSKNKLGQVIVLVELCLFKDDKQNAKKFLHEYKSLFFNSQDYVYWYEYIVRVEEKKEKLKEYEEELQKNTEMDEIQKMRLKCMFMQFDLDREQELEKLLNDIYEKTDKRLDQMNLISFYRSRRNWSKMLGFANGLIEKYNDVYGSIYKIQSLVELTQYDEALRIIEELEKRNINGIETELLQNKIQIYERLGQYSEAIEVGNDMLKIDPTEKVFLRLAVLYAINGDETGALNILLKAEEMDLLTVTICQRISVLYLTIDQHKAWRYADKAIKISGEQPEIMLWATNIANRVGKEEKSSELLHRVMADNPNHQLLTVKSMDEVLEIIKESNRNAEKRLQMLHDGIIPSHLFIDESSANQTYAEFFYSQWDANEIIPMEFGAHYYNDNKIDLDMNKIILDYSSCMLLHELGVFETLCDNLEQIYIVGSLFAIISEELRKISVNQPHLVQARCQTMKKCQEELDIDFVKLQVPERVEEYGALQRTNAISLCTAAFYGAEWVADDNEESIREIEVITSLYRKGKISQETFGEIEDQSVIIREEIVQKLINEKPDLFVDFDVIMKWDKHYLLPVICESFHVLIDEEAVDMIEREKVQVERKAEVCIKLSRLRNSLLKQKEKGKISLLPMVEEQADMNYSNMLTTILYAAEKEHIPMCIDDRMLTSYSKVGDVSIYNSFDLIKILFVSKKISLEQYSALYKLAIDKKIRYILPDANVMLYALKLSEYDAELDMLNEADILTGIRRYVVQALSENSFLRKEEMPHVQIPEWEYYVFRLQMCSRALIRMIWSSDMDYVKKCTTSEWTLCHYSQFAFDFSEKVNNKGRRASYAIQLADFLLEGFFLAKDEMSVDQYYEWLYGWFDNYLKANSDIRKRTLKYTQEFILSYLRDVTKKNDKAEVNVTKILFATGLYYMPEEYKEYMLANDMISKIYDSVYCNISIALTEKRQIPIGIFRAWEKDVLALDENTILVKNYHGITFCLSWEYIIPTLAGLTIKWEEDEIERVKRVFIDFGARLKHDGRNVRKKEFQYIAKYLEAMDCGKQYIELQNRGKYISAAEEIMNFLDMSKSFRELRIRRGINDWWLGNKETRKFIIPFNIDYFKKIYDCEVSSYDISGINDELILALPFRFGDIEIKQGIDNHNPIRLLHKFEGLLSSNANEKEILKVVSSLFSYTDNEMSKYGNIFIVFLRIIWNLFKELEAYKEQPDENLMIWTYVWADEMMTSLAKLETDGVINVADYTKKLAHDVGIDINEDGLWDSIERCDIISPVSINLFRLCVSGTLTICYKYRSNIGQSMAGAILTEVERKHKEWLKIPIYFREAELSHKNDENVFKTIFAENFYALAEGLGIVANCKPNMESWSLKGSTENRTKNTLQSIMNGNDIGLQEIIYLILKTRENMDLSQLDMVQDIIKKQVLEKEFQPDQKRQRLLTCIVERLAEDFLKEYVNHELARVGEMLHMKKIQCNEAYELVFNFAAIFNVDSLLDFWENHLEDISASEALQVAEKIAWIQRAISDEYSKRIRQLRMQLELKE